MYKSSFWKSFAIFLLIIAIFLGTLSVLMFIKLKKTPMFTRSGGSYAQFTKELLDPAAPVYGDDKVNFDLFAEAVYKAQNQYLYPEKAETKLMTYGAIKGLMTSLKDEYTTFMDPEFVRSLQEETRGEFGGLGIYISYREGNFTVSEPMPDTPAFKAGIKPGDIITEIEGKSTRDLNMDEVVQRLRGEKDTEVTITIQREDAMDPIKIKLKRDIIKIKFIRYEMVDKDIGFIKFSMFSENSAFNMSEAILDLQNKGMKKLILDLRYNPGGLLESAVNVTNLFVKKGIIVEVRGKKTREIHEAREFQCLLPEMPLIVLINEHSASASEILSGAVKDTNRGILVGKKTFGKGSVQQVYELENATEAMALKITVAEYFTPAGNAVNGKGIKPHFEIDFPKTTIADIYMANEIKNDKKNLIKDFLKKYPNPSKENIDSFKEELKNKCIPVNNDILGQLIQDELDRNKAPQIAYPKYDVQLKKAIEIFNTGKYKTKKTEFFFDNSTKRKKTVLGGTKKYKNEIDIENKNP